MQKNSLYTDKLKIAFVGQPEFFRCTYENDLQMLYTVKEFKLIFNAPWYYYVDLVEFSPDITFFFGPQFYPEELLKKLKGIKIGLSSEPIPFYLNGKLYKSRDRLYRFNSLKNVKNKYDKFYHFCKQSIPFLIEQGFKVDGEFVFPVATDSYKPINYQKQYDVFFSGRETEHRMSYLGILLRDYKAIHIGYGIYGEEYVRLISRCKIGLNIHVDNLPSLEHRVQNMMACGIMVMSETLLPNDFFTPGKDYVEFRNKKDFWGKFIYHLNQDSERELIAKNGLKTVREKLNSVTCFKKLIDDILKTG